MISIPNSGPSGPFFTSPAPNREKVAGVCRILADWNIDVRTGAAVPLDEIHFSHPDGRLDVARWNGTGWYMNGEPLFAIRTPTE